MHEGFIKGPRMSLLCHVVPLRSTLIRSEGTPTTGFVPARRVKINKGLWRVEAGIARQSVGTILLSRLLNRLSSICIHRRQVLEGE